MESSVVILNELIKEMLEDYPKKIIMDALDELASMSKEELQDKPIN
jgi:hypothetical protein